MYHILRLIHVCQMYASYDYGNKNENFTPKIKKTKNKKQSSNFNLPEI